MDSFGHSSGDAAGSDSLGIITFVNRKNLREILRVVSRISKHYLKYQTSGTLTGNHIYALTNDSVLVARRNLGHFDNDMSIQNVKTTGKGMFCSNDLAWFSNQQSVTRTVVLDTLMG